VGVYPSFFRVLIISGSETPWEERVITLSVGTAPLELTPVEPDFSLKGHIAIIKLNYNR
jgi:hypothetical protein